MAHEDSSQCLERSSPFGTGVAYCQWDEVTGSCSYAEPSFSWQSTVIIAIIVALFTALFDVPLRFIFVLLEAPAVDVTHKQESAMSTLVK